MSDESFPNAEKLLQAAFASKNPAPELTRLIKAHPTPEAADELLFYYTEAAEENPARADALAKALVEVRDSPSAPSIGADGIVGQFSRKLADLHSRGLGTEENSGSVDPSNSYLINSYLSALSFKYNLSSSSDMYGAIQDGLDVEGKDSSAQATLIGACIQLLTFGSGIVTNGSSYWSGAAEIATKLNAQKKRGVIKDRHLGEFLDLTIANAEKGFQAEDNVENVWGKLFPSES